MNLSWSNFKISQFLYHLITLIWAIRITCHKCIHSIPLYIIGFIAICYKLVLSLLLIMIVTIAIIICINTIIFTIIISVITNTINTIIVGISVT